MALRIKLKLNAQATVTAPFTLKPPIGGEIKFEKDQVITGQHDGEDNPFWIKHEEFVAPIQIFEPIKIEYLEDVTEPA